MTHDIWVPSQADGEPAGHLIPSLRIRPTRSGQFPVHRTLLGGQLMRRLKVFGILITAGLLAAACSSSSSSAPSSSSTGSAKPSGTLTIDNESGGTWTCDFNPFNLSYIGYSLGNVYEPLMFVNTLQSGKITPWLATSYAWSNGNKNLTFTIRKGVKFSNGDTLTPADVVYTFNLLKKYPTLDINSVWSILSSVTAQGSDQVLMTFKTVSVPSFYYIADQTELMSRVGYFFSRLNV